MSRKNKLRPGDILGALTDPDIKLDAAFIGKTDIKDFSFDFFSTYNACL
ncbi:MAG: DbpA RNA binding domain-containing protein [Bdellovibrionaceae bacterium]|nr:DbpA RNA binding domain-containing protein [Pseudobdellovibrionaceae bacterium]NUM57389.1 DbpA RNA binding domain-containing protein [Pseudobdellovibrionaceae bacterium]